MNTIDCMRIRFPIKKIIIALALLCTISLAACSKRKADFSLLLARIEQQPGTVSEKLLNALIDKAETIEQKMTLLRLCLVQDKNNELSVLLPQQKQLILTRLLQSKQNETVRYCALSLLLDNAYVDELFHYLDEQDIRLHPEFCAELFLSYPEKTFDNSKITPEDYAFLAATINSAELYILAAVHSFLQKNMQYARLSIVQALSNGIQVHPVLLWHAGLYEAIIEHYSASNDDKTLLYVLDAAYQTGHLNIIESSLEKIESSGTVTKKVKNVRSYFFYKKSQEFAQKNQNMPWTNTYQEENDYLQKACMLLQENAESFFNAASYAVILFQRGNFEAYSQFINSLPDTDQYEYLKYLHAIQFKKSNSLKAYLIKVITTSQKIQLIEQAFLALIHHKWWEDFAVLYKQVKTNSGTINNKFLDFVYYLITSETQLPVDTYITMFYMMPENILVSLNKSKFYLLQDKLKEAETILETTLKTDTSKYMQIYIYDLLIEVEKKLHNESKLQLYTQKHDAIKSNILPATGAK
ncbi:MAG TPA: hypothetical protein PK746_02670 [Spirochaetales bacterium]|nr:hypothetical protein [Spirochaetales bacterium]